MPASPEAIHDLAVHHRIALNRYSNAVVRRVLALVRRVEESILARLTEADLTDLNRARLEQTLEELRRIEAQGWQAIDQRLLTDLDALAENELDFGTRLAQAAGATRVEIMSGRPSLTQVIAAARARPFSGRVLKDWLKDAEEGQARRVREIIRQGVVEGQTIDQMVRAIRGTRAAQYRDGALETSRRSAETMVRTAITHVANVAHQQVFEANADVITGVIWTSTLDGRTSNVCMARSERVYPLNSGPRPPAHPNCRSVMRPQIAPIPGVTPFEPKSYGQWLKGQSAEIQDDILGPKRGALFRRGGLALDRFVDHAGKTLTLAQLRSRDAAAFRRAGLE